MAEYEQLTRAVRYVEEGASVEFLTLHLGLSSWKARSLMAELSKGRKPSNLRLRRGFLKSPRNRREAMTWWNESRRHLARGEDWLYHAYRAYRVKTIEPLSINQCLGLLHAVDRGDAEIRQCPSSGLEYLADLKCKLGSPIQREQQTSEPLAVCGRYALESLV